MILFLIHILYCSGITGANDRDLFTSSVSDLVLESREVSECTLLELYQ